MSVAISCEKINGYATNFASFRFSLHRSTAVIRLFEKANEVGEHIQTYDSFDVLVEKRIPLFLSPQDGWQYIFDVLKEFPELTVVLTNYGLWGSDRFFFPLIRAYKNVYIDTSDYQVINGINKFCNKFGDERLLFGSNFPMDYFGGPITALMSSDLPVESLEKIASGNLERLISEVRL